MTLCIECATCHCRDVIYLEEFEAEVYHANRCLYYPCKRCRESTIWNETAHQPTARTPAIVWRPPAPEPRTRNERQHTRVRCRLLACIRYKRHFDEEVLEVNDVSRGGISFIPRKYLPQEPRLMSPCPTRRVRRTFSFRRKSFASSRFRTRTCMRSAQPTPSAGEPGDGDLFKGT